MPTLIRLSLLLSSSLPLSLFLHTMTVHAAISGRSRISRREVQVQADYYNSMCCYIVPGRGDGNTLALVMQRYSGGVILCRGCVAVNYQRKMFKTWISEITSAGYSGILYSKHWSCSCRICRTCSTAPVQYVWLCSLISVLPYLLLFNKKKGVMGGADSFLLSWLVKLTYHN